MNVKLLKELSKQAETECGWSEEKFAELIVRECAEVAGCNGHVSGFSLGDLIKQHFGIKE